MTDELLPFPFSRHKRLETLHIVHCRLPGFVALLHGRHHNFLYALRFYRPALRETTIEEREFIEAHFCSFLRKPLYPFIQLRRRNGQMQMPLPGPGLGKFVYNPVRATMIGRHRYLSLIETAPTVHQPQFIPFRHTQHANGMLRIFLGQLPTPDIGLIEKTFLFHQSPLSTVFTLPSARAYSGTGEQTEQQLLVRKPQK